MMNIFALSYTGLTELSSAPAEPFSLAIYGLACMALGYVVAVMRR